MRVISNQEVIQISGGYSLFEITTSTTLWGAIVGIWRNDPIWILCGLLAGLILSGTKVADHYFEFDTDSIVPAERDSNVDEYR